MPLELQNGLIQLYITFSYIFVHDSSCLATYMLTLLHNKSLVRVEYVALSCDDRLNRKYTAAPMMPMAEMQEHTTIMATVAPWLNAEESSLLDRLEGGAGGEFGG